MGSIAYGEGKETKDIKSAAPLGKTGDVQGMPASEVRAAAQEPVTKLFAPTQRPEEEITTGVDVGPGPGSEALAMKNNATVRKISDILAEMIPFDDTGEVIILYQQALARGN
jgi:hypothetical protein